MGAAVFTDTTTTQGRKETEKMIARIIKGEQKDALGVTLYRYFDRNGTELFDGDVIRRVTENKIETLYRTKDGGLGTDATNPKWIEIGRAVPCEYGIYPLNEQEMSDIELIKRRQI